MNRSLRGPLSTLTYHALRAAGRARQGLRVLMYHRVTDAHPGDRLCVLPGRFAEQLRWLHEHGYDTMTFAEAVTWVSRAGHPAIASGKTPIVLTFDDGFEDNYRFAYPAMARVGFTGIFFAPSAFIERGRDGHAPADRPMSWDQLRELLREGHEVGSHSVSHAKLARIPREAMRREVVDSKRALEQALEHPVDFFCYPAGDYDAEVKRVVREAGYRGACTVKPGANAPGADPYALTRTEISALDSLWDFEKKLAGAFDWLHRAVQGGKS